MQDSIQAYHISYPFLFYTPFAMDAYSLLRMYAAHVIVTSTSEGMRALYRMDYVSLRYLF